MTKNERESEERIHVRTKTKLNAMIAKETLIWLIWGDSAWFWMCFNEIWQIFIDTDRKTYNVFENNEKLNKNTKEFKIQGKINYLFYYNKLANNVFTNLYLHFCLINFNLWLNLGKLSRDGDTSRLWRSWPHGLITWPILTLQMTPLTLKRANLLTLLLPWVIY